MKQRPEFDKMGVYEYYPHQRERFKAGELVEEWYKKYPSIFDEQDLVIARHQSSLNFHFFEWLAAIILYQTLGFNSLVEQYEFKNHKRKQEILRKTLPDDLFKLVTNHKTQFGGTQSPDLFVYSPDYSEWFFCEAKGNRDKVTKTQKEYFNALGEVAHKPVRIIQFRPYLE